MPVYEYECGSCGGRFEVIRKFSDPSLAACKLCNAADIRKLLSPAAFVLKGSGWYATDYASKKGCEEKDCGESKKDSKPDPGCSAGACPSGGCAAKG